MIQIYFRSLDDILILRSTHTITTSLNAFCEITARKTSAENDVAFPRLKLSWHVYRKSHFLFFSLINIEAVLYVTTLISHFGGSIIAGTEMFRMNESRSKFKHACYGSSY